MRLCRGYLLTILPGMDRFIELSPRAQLIVFSLSPLSEWSTGMQTAYTSDASYVGYGEIWQQLTAEATYALPQGARTSNALLVPELQRKSKSLP